MSYTIDHRFRSAGYCVYEGTLNYSWTNATDQKVFKFSVREVTVLKLLDHQIVEHTDYADYESWIAQYKSQL
jgi:hypothetical protein